MGPVAVLCRFSRRKCSKSEEKELYSLVPTRNLPGKTDSPKIPPPPFPVLMFSSQSVVFPGNCGQCLPPTKKFPCPPPPTKAHFKKKPGNDCRMSATRNEVRFFPYFSISLLFQTSFDISTAGRGLKMAGSRGKHGRYSGLLNPEEDRQPCRRLSYRESSWQPTLGHIYR